MRKIIGLIIVVNFLLICLSGKSYCHAADSRPELDWDYLIPYAHSRDIKTVSLHTLKKISETNNRSIYRGITITRPYGHMIWEQQKHDSDAVGVGPIYMIRDEKYHSGKLTVAVDISGGFTIYNKKFPAGGEYYNFYNFMWRIGPRFIYKIDENSSLNIGYMLMHVSNGLRTHNPSYNAHGVSLGFVTNF